MSRQGAGSGEQGAGQVAGSLLRAPCSLLLWCAPALALGLALRVLMASAMPFAYVQHDSYRLLVGGAEWLRPEAQEAFGDNVPFLVPALFRLAQAGPLPALTTIQLGQHALGLIQIVLAGALVRFWLPRWKWWIIPATLVFAAHPSFLWFEHTVMLETAYVFAVVVLAVAGTWLLRQPSLAAAMGTCVAVALVAFTRPEGKLFVAFGALALVAAFWKSWRQLARAAAIFSATLALIAWGTVPGESGLLLYSSVLHLSPEVPRCHPGVGPYVAALCAEAIEAARREPAFVSRRQREALTDALKNFVAKHPGASRGADSAQGINRVATSLAFETCLRAPLSLLPLAMQKFRDSADDLANGKFTESWLHERQQSRLRSGWHFIQPIDVQLYGRQFADVEELLSFVKDAYPPKRLRWFGWLHEEWRDLYELRLPDTKYPAREVHGLPLFYLLPLAGMIAAIAWPMPARRFHVCWVLMLVGLWFIVMLTANERARFRMGFEPFIFLYPFVAFDAAIALVQRVQRR